MIRKIISGGQTGADRAALDFALENGIEYGGFLPRGRLAEDGPLDPRYRNMTESSSAENSVRTGLNVAAADLTVIISHGPLSGGSRATLEYARKLQKPCLHLDLDLIDNETAAKMILGTLEESRAGIVNIAGPRASEDPDIYDSVQKLLRTALRSPKPLWNHHDPR